MRELLCSSLKQERQPPLPALHTAGAAPRVSQGSANLSHPSALPSPGKRQRLAAAAPSDFQASAKQLGKTAPAPSSLLQALRKQSRVWACESRAQQTICYSRIAKNAPVWPAWTCWGWHSPSSWHFWCFPLLRACQGAWGIPTELEETKETQVLLTALHQDEVQPETTEFVLGFFFFLFNCYFCSLLHLKCHSHCAVPGPSGWQRNLQGFYCLSSQPWDKKPGRKERMPTLFLPATITKQTQQGINISLHLPDSYRELLSKLLMEICYQILNSSGFA